MIKVVATLAVVLILVAVIKFAFKKGVEFAERRSKKRHHDILPPV